MTKIMENTHKCQSFCCTKEHGNSGLDNIKKHSYNFGLDDHKRTAVNEGRKAFVTTHHKWYSLNLADRLESYLESLPEDEAKKYDEVNKAVRNLRWCSNVSVVESYNGVNRVVATSNRCKNKNCAICARIRSGKIATRFNRALEDKENENLFKNIHFYHLTLTLKHDLQGLRSNVYLKELKAYMTRLFRSNLMQGLMPKGSGRISSFEVTFTDNGFHIHSHILLACPRITTKINDIQAMIQAKWLKITGDSSGASLDLVRPKLVEGKKCYKAAIKEIVKYSTKIGNLSFINRTQIGLYSDFIQGTKGANFVNASGIFRGLELASDKSKYDEPVKGQLTDERDAIIAMSSPSDEVKDGATYKLVRTSKIIYSEKAQRNYGRKKLTEKIKKGITIKRVKGIPCTEIAREVLDRVSSCKVENSSFKSFEKFIAKELKKHRQNQVDEEQLAIEFEKFSNVSALLSSSVFRDEEILSYSEAQADLLPF